MNAEQALQLCRLAKTISPAQAVDEFTPAAWALILEDVRFEDARQALKELGGEQEWIHVSHIVARVKRIRRDRVLDFGTLPDPPAGLDPDDTGAHAQWLRETTEAIADGNYTREDVATESLTGCRDVIKELGQVGQAVDTAEILRQARANNDAARQKVQEREAESRRRRDERQAELEAMRAADREARATRCDMRHGEQNVPNEQGEAER